MEFLLDGPVLVLVLVLPPSQKNTFGGESVARPVHVRT